MTSSFEQGSFTSGESTRKPRRGRAQGKRFPCTYGGCRKVYTRAEHLQRHRLNHIPKELFCCPVQGCTGSFVRKDLYLRHKERHEQHLGVHSSSSQQDFNALRAAGSVPERQHLSDGFPTPADPYTPGPEGSSEDPNIGFGLTPSEVDLGGSARPRDLIPQGGNELYASITREPQNHSPGDTIGDQLISPSPSSTDEFTAWLFDAKQTQGQFYFSDLGLGSSWDPATFQSFQQDDWRQPISLDPTTNDNSTSYGYVQSNLTNTLGPLAPLKKISAQKRLQLISIMTDKLAGAGDDDSTIPTGNFDDEEHPLSLKFMNLYLESYWRNFNEYLPILHEPTFFPDKTEVYLVLAVLTLGLAMLNRQRDFAGPDSRLSNFLALKIRWHVLMHTDASPPGRLWVFQTLLLLEVHDKLLATKVLHERALIYFPTTLTLMRRSSTLFGRQVSKPRKTGEDTQMEVGAGTTKTAELSVGFFAPHPPSTPPPEIWWEHWIAQEAIRRAAFAAFILDTTHSVMFGQTQTLVFNELHLFLPCDRLLWSSKSPVEVGAVESTLYANGVKSLSFLEGLKRIMSCQPCRTNEFGRIVLLAGLLSVISHMQQRDMLGTTLGSDSSLMSQEKWQPKLMKALDWWKKDYEDTMAHLRGATLDWQKLALSGEDRKGGAGDDTALAISLYRLGHIHIYITVPELGVFAGAGTILGRPVSPFEKRMIQEKITRWANSSLAVHAVYHALELIRFILLPHSPRNTGGYQSHTYQEIEYEAVYDKVPNRSWALYYATMVVWAYGFRLDGPIATYPYQLHYPPESTHHGHIYVEGNNVGDSSPDDISAPTTTLGTVSPSSFSEHNAGQRKAARVEDFRAYMDYMMPPSALSVQDLDRHLKTLVGGRNKLIGLLSVVDTSLAGSSWELLEEARDRLKSAAVLLKGVQRILCDV